MVLPALLGLAGAAGAASDTPAIAPPPDWVVAERWTAPEKFKENTSGEDFLLLDEQTRLATEETYRHNVYQIVTDSGRQSSSQVSISFDPSYQTLTLHQLRLIRGQEVFDKLDPAKLQVIQQERDLDRQLYDGERSALLILDDVRVGDILDVAYTLRGANPVFAGRFIDTQSLEWGVPVHNLRYRLLVPAGRTISAKSIGPTGLAPVVQSRDGEQELTWRRTDVPMVESDDRTPSSHVAFSFVDLSEFADWNAVVRWAEPMYARDDRPQPMLDEVVAGICARARTPEQQAVAALAFVQQEIRYLGIEMGPGSHRPTEPAEVLRRRFGDCKDKSRLLTALLQRLGLDAAPALVNSSQRDAVRDRLPTPYAFDHAIVALDLGGRRYLLDPTLSYQRGDQLAERHIGRYGPYLRIAGGNAGLGTAELGPRDVSDTEIREDFQVAAVEKPAVLTVTTKARGRAADNLRAHFATRSLDQISREYLDYYTTYYPSITLLQPVEHADDPADNTYTTIEHYQVARLFTHEDDERLLRAEFEPSSVREYTRNPNLTQRRQPLAIRHPLRVKEQINITVAEDWPITPFDDTVEDAAFTVRAQAKNVTPRHIQLEYSWTSKAERVEPAELATYAANTAKARKNLGFQLSWTSPPAATAFSPPPAVKVEPTLDVNWLMVTLSVFVLLAGGWVSWWLVRMENPVPFEAPALADPATPVDPSGPPARLEAAGEGIGGWLILVAFGVTVRPFVLLFQIQSNHHAYYSATIWDRLTTPGSAQYNAHFSLVAPLELVVNFVLLVYAVLLPVLFFRRSYLLPRAIQIHFLVGIGAALFSYWDTAMVNPGAATLSLENNKALLQAVLGSAVWIPYFQVSQRVKRTFVR